MSKLDEIKNSIENLADDEIAQIYHWLSEKDWERWDTQIEADSEAGRLDFLIEEAKRDAHLGL